MRIVFLGTPDFARASLEALLRDGQDVIAVFTQPDRAKGRGMQLSFSPVKELAVVHGIPVYQPETFKDGEAVRILRALSPDLVIAVAYGRILPEDFLAVPRLGSINLHGSLLPRYRGAAPIQWAVLNGDKTTGVTVQYMSKRMDAGDIISTAETEIGEFETSGKLFDRLMIMGAELLVKTVRSMADGTAARVPQNEEDATYTVMLDKSMCPIDWSKMPREIVKHICGLDPWPVATARLRGTEVRVFGAEYTENDTTLAPGKIVSAGKKGIEVACGGGKTLLLTEIQPAGKKRMSAAAFLLGHPIKADE
ncbi:MAG: methionyl-tRNA formyltransferase [Oscillospiraceae bacterium]|nr:methionyl-tRNA formyltransferase [Oscillospiraceae bacterium]